MGPRESTNYRDPLDVLRRFVPTPYRAKCRLGSIEVDVETNDIALLPAILPDEDGKGQIEGEFRWKLVRDHDVRGELDESLFFTSDTLTVVNLGAACLVGIDHERRELLGFLGGSVDSRTFRDFLLPFLCRLSTEVVREGLDLCMPDLEDETYDA